MPFDEECSFKLITLYKELGYINEALNYYQVLEKDLKEEYDMAPSERIKLLIKGE